MKVVWHNIISSSFSSSDFLSKLAGRVCFQKASHPGLSTPATLCCSADVWKEPQAHGRRCWGNYWNSSHLGASAVVLEFLSMDALPHSPTQEGQQCCMMAHMSTSTHCCFPTLPAPLLAVLQRTHNSQMELEKDGIQNFSSTGLIINR